MKIFRKTRYLRIVITLLPFGIVSILGGIQQFNNIPNKVEELNRNEGCVLNVGIDQHYIEKLDNYVEVYKLKTTDNKEYYTELKKNIELLELKNISKNDNVIIWTKLDNNSIKQIELNGEIIIQYEPPYWMAWFFMLIGILFVTMSIYYLIKYNSDFF